MTREEMKKDLASCREYAAQGLDQYESAQAMRDYMERIPLTPAEERWHLRALAALEMDETETETARCGGCSRSVLVDDMHIDEDGSTNLCPDCPDAGEA